jgi:hypothetical protein
MSAQLTAAILASERMLRLAVLEQAVRDLQLARRIARESTRSRFRDDARLFLRRTEAWFEDRADSWPYGFESLCMGIDLEPDALRRRLRIGGRFRHTHRSPERSPLDESVQPLVAGARPA